MRSRTNRPNVELEDTTSVVQVALKAPEIVGAGGPTYTISDWRIHAWMQLQIESMNGPFQLA
jgi:hypothetical protein